MKVLRDGHRYELENFEKEPVNEQPDSVQGNGNQVIQFIEKAPIAGSEGLLTTVHNGTTNEELLEVLIDRLSYLQGKVASKETACAITKLEEGLMWLNKRTQDRKKRNVEGTRLK